MGYGFRHQIWNKQLDDKLLLGITEGKNLTELEIVMKMSCATIRKRLREMGFENYKDAKIVLCQ